MKRLFQPETLFFILTWFGLMVAFRDRAFYDPGALWHIKVGEIILQKGMPQTDPFSYTFEGQRWVPQQWGAEVLMALAHRTGGLDALLLGFATGVAFLYTLIFRRALQGGMGPVLAGGVVSGALVVGAFHYYARPHMFTIAFLAWTMMCLIDYERGRCTEWRLAGLIPLYVLWVNLHGGILGGIMMLGLAVTGWGVLFLTFGKSQSPIANREVTPPSSNLENTIQRPATPIRSWRTAWLLIGIVLACGLTPFVNPHGVEMIRIWQKIVGSKVLPQTISEHMPMDPLSPLGLAIVGLGVFYLVLLLGTLPGLPRVSWLLPLVWFILSFKGIRQGPLFAVCAAVAITDLWKHTLWHRLLAKYGDGSTAWNPDDIAEAQQRFVPLPAVFAAPMMLIGIAFVLDAQRIAIPVVGHGWARLDPNLIPSDITPEVTAYANSVPPGTRIFNDANLGGYLIYHTPSLKIFMDDRCELYGDQWIKDYADTMSKPPEELGLVFEQWAAEYQFERAIIIINPPGHDKPPIEQYLSASPAWKEVVRGKRAAIYQRVR